MCYHVAWDHVDLPLHKLSACLGKCRLSVGDLYVR